MGCCRSGSDVFGVCWSEGPLERAGFGLGCIKAVVSMLEWGGHDMKTRL